MSRLPGGWSDEADAVIRGDLTIAVAYVTPAGGAAITSISPLGTADREAGVLSFTTSLGFPKKLGHILRDPYVAFAYHTRQHGFATSTNAYLLAQGNASVDFRPSPERSADFGKEAVRFLGPSKHGLFWDWLLHEYHQERVFVDLSVERLAAWPELTATGPMTVQGEPWPDVPAEQAPPKNGTGPRVDVAEVVKRIAKMPHRLLAYRGADGFPVIVPVRVAGHDAAGLRLDVPAGLLPPGGRRAGFLAHTFNPQCAGLSMRTLTGWLTVDAGNVTYAPHTSKGLGAPSSRTVQALGNGTLAKYGIWRARRDGTAARLQKLADNARA